MRDQFRKITHWVWFSLAITLLPILFSTWRLYGLRENISLICSFELAISHGELLIVCMAILGVSIGELIKGHTEWKTLQYWLVGLSFVLALFTSYSFSEIATNKNLGDNFAFGTSIMMFISASIVSISSLLLPKQKIANIDSIEDE